MNNTMQQGAKDQAILPFRSALRLCIRGIETRFGRSVVTLVGVALGIAFLMSVLSGFHIKQALSTDAAIARDAARRVAILRSQVGLLRDRQVAILAPSNTRADDVFIKEFIATGIKRVEVSAEPAFTVLLGAVHDQIDRDTVAHLAAQRVYVFESPTPALAQELEAGGVQLRVLSVALRPDEIRKAQRHVEQERYRMMWIVVCSLLITIGGITNAMLMSVTERFREIATMKCLGALSGFVVKIFLIESSLMGLAGGIAGCLVGVLLPLVAYGYMFGFGRVLSAVNYSRLGGYALVCASVGMFLAMVAGIYPARIAAKMIPADALRSEV